MVSTTLPPYRTDTTTDIYQLLAGLRGKLPIKDWTWEVYGSHGKSHVNAHLPESFLSQANSQLLFTIDLYGRGWRNPATLTVAGSCTSGLPIFNNDGSVNSTPSVSQDCSDWMTLRMNNVSDLVQEVAEAKVTGHADRPLGWPDPVRGGADYRTEYFKFVPDAAYNANQITANVVNNVALPLAVTGRTWVTEAYAELAIPILNDLPFVKKLEIDPGYRTSDYKTGGSVGTWKIMGDWSMIDEVTFRGGFHAREPRAEHQRAVHARGRLFDPGLVRRLWQLADHAYLG